MLKNMKVVEKRKKRKRRRPNIRQKTNWIRRSSGSDLKEHKKPTSP